MAAICLCAGTAWGGRIAPELLEKLDKGEPGRKYAVIVKMATQAGSFPQDAGMAVDGEEGASSFNGPAEAPLPNPPPSGEGTGRTFPHEARGERLTRVAQALRLKSERSQRAVRAHLEKREREGKVAGVTHFWIFDGIALSASAEVIRELAERTDVGEVELDRIVAMAVPVTAAAVPGSWNLERINLAPLWDRGIQGAGTVVATLDSGVDGNHPDLAARWRGAADGWFDPYDGSTTPFDENGHGTGVMGVLVGGSTNGIPLGVAPQATWIAAKVFHNALNPVTGRIESVAEVSKIHAGFQWLLGLGAGAPDVVNGSWDLDAPGTVDSQFRSDVQLLKSAGIEVVFAAGNAGPHPNTSVSPANYPESLAVGATDQRDLVASFSSRGPSAFDGVTSYPTLVAPGDGITTRGLTYGGAVPDATQVVSGTSFAAPHVAGVYVLLQSALPGASAQEIEAALTGAIAGAAPDNDAGYGRLDAGKAFSWLAVPGDVNGDGRVNIGDAVTVLRAVVNPGKAVGLVLKNGDLFPAGAPDGQITIEDALLVLQRAVGAR